MNTNKQAPWMLIQNKYPSKRLVLYGHQANLFVKAAKRLIHMIEEKRMDLDDFLPITRSDEYLWFIDVSYACGFVCRDISPTIGLIHVNEHHQDVIPTWSLLDIKKYMHTLLRSERWSDAYSSDICEAIKSGALLAIVDRLENDRSLQQN